ncbi:CaiB/BaiF CoA-transferase family protein [Oceanicola sp. 502str15]|uniref:CaiB/BaiF CoA transferase family protein n=1 Tax=Oceanicola sp. 502str15 TaxID=2696061 RepID=UPI002095358A|nr:CoA transferase [Oceanicola sp. 502str15]MCO6384861.1 CoA transferase [Oceanicola sp. 502str15]
MTTPRQDQTGSTPLPLAGLRIIDLTQVMAGPFCCMMLGDMGADVIKIEPPKGDQTRASMGFRMKGTDSPGFLALNRNKRSVTLDLKTEGGRQMLLELVKTADVVVENYRPGVTKRLGIDYDTLSALNPKLVYASISGFGQTGPWSQRPGFDLIAQAMSGVMSAMGHPDTGPVKSGVSVGDLGAGLFCLYGILSAIIGRGTTGRGQYVDASLFEAALSLSIWETTEFWATGQSPKPLGTANRMSAPYQAFTASDGMFVVGAANQKLWDLFCEVIGRPDIHEDPRFMTNKDRVANRHALVEALAPVFIERTATGWVDAFLDRGVPAGPINDFGQVFEADHTKARDMIMRIEHPTEGEMNALGFPVKLRGTPQQVRYAPPLLGQHTDELAGELGFDAAKLRAEGAFG